MSQTRAAAVLVLSALASCASPGPASDVPPDAPPVAPAGDPGGAGGAASATLFRIILPVSDLDEAVRFYAGVLEAPGVPVSGGRHYFDCGATILACFDPVADGDGYEPTPLPEWIYFAVDGVEAARERCRAAGAGFEPGGVGGAPAGEVARRPWGELSFYARDPFGNGICFVERSTAFTGRRP